MHLFSPSSATAFKVTTQLTFYEESLNNILIHRLDADIAAIKHRLDHLCGLVSIDLVGQKSRIFERPQGYLPELPQLREYPLDECIISRHWRSEFPFLTIQTPSTMCLLDLDPRLAAQLVARERTDVSMLLGSSGPTGFLIPYEDGMRSAKLMEMSQTFH